MAAHTWNSSNWQAEVEDGEWEVSLDYTARPYLNKPNQPTKQTGETHREKERERLRSEDKSVHCTWPSVAKEATAFLPHFH